MYGCLKWKVPFCRGTPPTGGMFFYLHYQPTPILYPTVNEKFTAIVPTIHCMTKPAFVWYGEVAADTHPGATAAIFGSLGTQPPPAFQRTPFVPPEPQRQGASRRPVGAAPSPPRPPRHQLLSLTSPAIGGTRRLDPSGARWSLSHSAHERRCHVFSTLAGPKRTVAGTLAPL